MVQSTSPSRPTGAHPSWRPGPKTLFLLGLLLAVLVGVWFFWSVGSSGRALRSLRTPERHLVYQRTIDDLRALCGPDHPRALHEHCRELAETVAPLPECDAACAELVRPILTPAPTR